VTTINRIRTFLATSVLACSPFVSPVDASALQQEETAQQFIERMQSAIADDEWGRAKSGIRRFLALNPDSPDAHFLAGRVYFHEGARSMAIESLEKAIRDQPFFPEAHLLLARCLLEDGRKAKAREEMNTAIAQGTRLFPAYRFLGEIDLAEGKLEAAVSSFEAALRVSESGDEIEAEKLQGQLSRLPQMIENLKRFAVLEAEQNALDIVRPVLLSSATPRYTDEARNQKVQGTISMAIRVNETGEVDSVLLLRGLGYGLDEQAEETVRKLKFSPATRNGKPIPHWTKLLMDFNLR
jgi:TonB family protein